MFKGDFNDDIWDEYDWEAHLREVENKSIDLRKFLATDSSDSIPRWLILLQDSIDERDAVDNFIEEELQIDEAYFPEEEDIDETDLLDELDDFFPDDADEQEEDFPFDEEDDFDCGEEWKQLSGDFALSDYGSIDTFDVYNDARELAVHILQWAESISPNHITNEHNNFIGNVLKIGAKIAGGYTFGFEQEFLGGNIAYTKKALYCANDSLAILQQDLKGGPILTNRQYAYFHEQLFDLRNDIGIYIQELRERFYGSL